MEDTNYNYTPNSFTVEDMMRIVANINEYTSYVDTIMGEKKETTRRCKRNQQKKGMKKMKKVEYTPRPQEAKEGVNKKLRLLVTTKCHNKCPLCCNKQFDFDTLPIVDRWDYDEIMITGGEPLSSLKKVRYLSNLVQSIKAIQQAQGLPISKFYLYTSTHHAHLVVKIMRDIDGIVYTPHNLKELNTLEILSNSFRYISSPKSFRLNIPCDIKEAFESYFKYHSLAKEYIERFWEVKYIEWIKDCPIPEGEDFRRIYMLY